MPQATNLNTVNTIVTGATSPASTEPISPRVTGAQLANATITSTQMAAGSVTSSQIEAGAVGAARDPQMSIGTAQLAKPPQAGTLTVTAGAATSFSVSFPTSFASAPIVTASLQASNPASLTGARFHQHHHATSFTGTVQRTSATATLDSTGVVGLYTSVALVNGNPAICYYDSTNGNLKYVRANDASGTGERGAHP